MTPSSVAEVKQRILERFPRLDPKFSNAIEDDMPDWIRNLSETYPYSLLTLYPGQRIFSQFPFADAAALAALTPMAGHWVDTAWLVTSPGVATYDVYHPLEDQEADDDSWWVPCRMQSVDYVYEFSPKGNFAGSLDTPDFEQGLLMASFKSRGRPRMMMWQNLETKAQITFNPTPDKAYLYAVQFVLKDPPMYQDGVDGTGDPIIRNRFITAAPEAVILYGLLQAARFANESSMKQDFMMDLFGEDAANYGSGSSPKGGLLGKLKRDTIVRNRNARNSVSIFDTEGRATGKIPNALSNKQLIWGNRYRRYL